MRTLLLLLVGLSTLLEAGVPAGLDLYAKNCARCHEMLPPLHTRQQMKSMTPEFVLNVLTNGAMRSIGAGLSAGERKEIAEFVTEKRMPAEARGFANACATPDRALAKSGADWNGWGIDLNNSRFQNAPGFSAQQLDHLKLKWAFGFPEAFSTYSQPSVVGDRIFVGSPNGRVYSLDKQTGCTYWSFDAGAGVRSSITIGPGNIAYFGDAHAYVFALNAQTGRQIWKVPVDNYPSARVTGAPRLYRGVLYVPVASRDEWFAADPSFECCKFRGSVTALDAKTGSQIWKTYTISDAAHPLGKQKGIETWGPSGVGVWNSPTIDEKLGLLYVGTGDNYSGPASPMSDSILALSLADGKIVWKKQLTPGDVFTANCMQQNKTSCAGEAGPDADFGASPILHTQADGTRLLLVAQKSGKVYAIDPDQQGKVIWQTAFGKGGSLGGIQWGAAIDGEAVYVAISDLAFAPDAGGVMPDPKIGGGLHAAQIATGEKLWSAMPTPGGCERHGCSPAQSAAVTAIPGAVFSGSLDGHLRAYSSKDGAVIWDYDTVRDFVTVNKVPGKGGSLDGPGPVIVDGMLFVNSGYAFFNGMPGNVLLAFSVEQ